MSKMALNENQKRALDLVLSGHNVLITGPAGTGKSHVISEIVKKCSALGKKVSLTCTTGIACSVFSSLPTNAQTIHRWSGIEDGRYSVSEIKNVILHNPKYLQVLHNIRATDILIIDEISMLSKRLFEALLEVISVNDRLQLVVSGDFLQLAPVPNALYNEEGRYCFESPEFTTVFPHKIELTEIIRQKDKDFVNILKEVSSGQVSMVSYNYIKQLSNKPVDHDCVKLFSTNDRVDDFNRNELLKLDGDVYEYLSEDSGKVTALTHILAPRKLWLKIGAPVILLRNLSDKLVNGLRGKVTAITNEGPIVEFNTVGISLPVKKIKFTVFSPKENKDIAVREQLPLKLAFAITIHKAQGMTLDRVEVDCRGIFKPGQLGVAMSRARTSEGLKVTYFTLKACMSHPSIVHDFLGLPSQEPLHDHSCCKRTIRTQETPGFYSVHDVIAFDADVDAQCEDEFDTEFERLIEEIDSIGSDVDIPDDLNLDRILDNMKTKEVLTPFQDKMNRIIEYIDKRKYKEFVNREYSHLKELIEKMKVGIDKNVKCKDLGDFYTAVHKYMESAEYLMSCMRLFDEMFGNEHKSICYEVIVEIRKYLLDKYSEKVVSAKRRLTNRTVTNASRSRIRYVGGYVVAKLRFKYIRKKNAVRYSKKSADQQTYQEAAVATELVNGLQVDERYIIENTTDPYSLLDISRKQNTNRGLTNISDELFKFFLQLSEVALSIMTTDNINKHGSQFFESCHSDLIQNKELSTFFKCVLKNQETEITESCPNLDTILDKIYSKVIKMYLMVLMGQFRKDLIDVLDIEKKMAHRKQIKVGSAKQKKQTIATVEDEQLPSTSKTHHHSEDTTSSENLPSTSQPSASAVSDEDVCKKCHSEDNDVDWIQCDYCSSWLHRGCAGLKNANKWKKYKKKGAKFTCNECL